VGEWVAATDRLEDALGSGDVQGVVLLAIEVTEARDAYLAMLGGGS